MSADAPIVTAPLFPELSRRFVTLLQDLAPADWERPVSPAWRVRDVVAHLLDSSLRRLSAQRDGYQSRTVGPASLSYAALLDHLNALNADWVRATERLSPRALIDLIRWSDTQLAEFLASLDPDGIAIWPVAWAGETESRNWFDIAREYTEKWHHAQQVFDATGRPSTISDRALMHPCLDALMRALPHGLRNCSAASGSTVRVVITGEAGGSWTAMREGDGSPPRRREYHRTGDHAPERCVAGLYEAIERCRGHDAISKYSGIG